MGLLSKLFNLGEAGVNKIEEAIDDKWGVEIHEANIAKARKRLIEAQDKVDSAEARATIQKKDLEEYEAQVAKYENNLAEMKSLYEKAATGGDEETATKYRDLGFRVKAEIDKLKKQYAPQIEAYEFSVDSIRENRALIEEMTAEITQEEQMIKTVRSNQAMIDVHKAQTKLSEEIKGASIGGSSAVSKLQRRQEEEREKIRIQRERKHQKSRSLEDELNDLKKSSGDEMPW
ncbi:hypothetical protein VA7868_00194 [Vibrio aerogenes CECT 7868]|uniref:PspA/IM30 family protein n=1 Tax=Vibrio aerogenes CECT 7868 TaxID=1216006 RepID=A0A1M5UWW4_9VIBR|nr:hypothetical protein [Vibrio aerogenes]SHH67213.1 hypothetical protein VA7868_00194 [Vibrio aerogenes CECT 7868]